MNGIDVALVGREEKGDENLALRYLGAALVEAVLQLQGLGTLMLAAVMSQDQYLLMGSLLIGAVLLVAGNLLADVALTRVDPRISFD